LYEGLEYGLGFTHGIVFLRLCHLVLFSVTDRVRADSIEWISRDLLYLASGDESRSIESICDDTEEKWNMVFSGSRDELIIGITPSVVTREYPDMLSRETA
jgi:hypothetical protein